MLYPAQTVLRDWIRKRFNAEFRRAGLDRPVRDGTPDFLRLSDPADQAAFRRWFTLIAEYQAVRPKADIPRRLRIVRACFATRTARRSSVTTKTGSWRAGWK